MKLIAQIIGVIAICLWLISLQCKKKKDILIFQTVASLFYSLQYILLFAFSAALIDFTSAIRNIVFYFEEKKNNKISKSTLIIFITIAILIGTLTFYSWFSILPIIATLIYIYSLWQDNLKLTRYIFLLSDFIWLIHNLFAGAYVCVIGNILQIIFGIVAIIRFRKD